MGTRQGLLGDGPAPSCRTLSESSPVSRVLSQITVQTILRRPHLYLSPADHSPSRRRPSTNMFPPAGLPRGCCSFVFSSLHHMLKTLMHGKRIWLDIYRGLPETAGRTQLQTTPADRCGPLNSASKVAVNTNTRHLCGTFPGAARNLIFIE